MSDENKDSDSPSPDQPRKTCGHGGKHRCCGRRGTKALILLAVVGVAGFFAWKAWAGDEGFDCSAAAVRDPARMHARAEKFAERALGRFDMPAAHREAARQTLVTTADELQPLLAAHYDARVSLIDALSADRVDPMRLESLRAAAIQRADEASRKLVKAMATLGEQLTPEQRRQLLARWDDRHG